MNRITRPYYTEAATAPGAAVVRGSAENKVTAPDAGGGGDFIGIYAFDDNEAKAPGDSVGIAVSGVVKALAGGDVSAGKKAVIKDGTGALENAPEEGAGVYATCGVFLEDGAAGQYVDLLIEHGSLTVPAGAANEEV
jgi:hypothetical protein